MDFRILGPLEVSRDGVPVEIGGGQQRALLAVLLLHARETVSTDRLIDALWGERPPTTAAKSLQINVSRLRKALGDGAVVTRSSGYAIELDSEQLDLDRFRARVEEGRSALEAGDPRHAADVLQQALSLWRGPALGDLAYEPFAQTESAHLEELRLDALEARLEADLALARHAAVVSELERVVRQQPFRERLRAQLMLALYRSGRQADALDAYRQGRRLLVHALGIEPSPELRELEQRILKQDPVLAPPRQPTLPLIERIPGRPRPALLAAALLTAAMLAAVLAVTLRGSGQATLARVSLNAVGVIDPNTNKIVGQIPLGSPPTEVKSGDGALWVITSDDRVLWRIDPRKRAVDKTVGLDGSASGVAVTPDAVWVLNARGLGGQYPGPEVEISRVDPTYGSVISTFPTGTEYTDLVEGVLASRGGALWAVDEGANPTWRLLRINPDRRRVTRARPLGGTDIATTGDAVWSAFYGEVLRIDPRTEEVVARINVAPAGGPEVEALAVAGDGSVWSANAYPELICPPTLCKSRGSRPGTATRIDPGADAVTATVTVGLRPVAIAVGAGSVWVANRTGKSISRIDPKTNRVLATIKLGNPPAGIAVGEGMVWVTVG